MTIISKYVGFLIFFIVKFALGTVQIYRYYYVQKFGKEVIFKSFLLRKWQQGKNIRYLKEDNIKQQSKGYLYSGIFCIVMSIVAPLFLLSI